MRRSTALRAGADDYVTKPFAFEELLARVEALAGARARSRRRCSRVGDLVLDQDTREVHARAASRSSSRPRSTRCSSI